MLENINSSVLVVNSNISGSKNFLLKQNQRFFPYCGVRRNIVLTKSSSEAAYYLKKLNPDVVEFFGGDGTFSSTLNDILSSEPDFLKDKYVRILPGGSGNDRFKSLYEYKRKSNYLSNYSKDLGLITDDYLLANINDKLERYVFNVAGIGLDSQTLLEFDSLRNNILPGSLKYSLAGLKAIHKLNGSEGCMFYESSDFKGSSDALMFLFMLGKYFGGGKPINNKFVMNDGLFESVVLKRGSHFDLYSSLVSLSFFKQDQRTNNLVNYFEPVDELDLFLENNKKFFFESDGELLKDKYGLVPVESINMKIAGKVNYLV